MHISYLLSALYFYIFMKFPFRTNDYFLFKDVPDEPNRLDLVDISETSATIQWIPGASGGYEQMFYVEYKVMGNSQWTRIQIPVQEIIVKQETRLSYRLADLLPGKMYEIRLLSSNHLGDSTPTEGIVFMTGNIISFFKY